MWLEPLDESSTDSFSTSSFTDKKIKHIYYSSISFIRVKTIVIKSKPNNFFPNFCNITRITLLLLECMFEELLSLLLNIEWSSRRTRENIKIPLEFEIQSEDSFDMRWMKTEDLHITYFLYQKIWSIVCLRANWSSKTLLILNLSFIKLNIRDISRSLSNSQSIIKWSFLNEA